MRSVPRQRRAGLPEARPQAWATCAVTWGLGSSCLLPDGAAAVLELRTGSGCGRKGARALAGGDVAAGGPRPHVGQTQKRSDLQILLRVPSDLGYRCSACASAWQPYAGARPCGPGTPRSLGPRMALEDLGLAETGNISIRKKAPPTRALRRYSQEG